MNNFICFDCETDLGPFTGPQGQVKCPSCKAQWEFAQITQATKASVQITPKPHISGASCFNHEENEAECECACGKFLCAVCAMRLQGVPTCADCYISPDVRDPLLKKQRAFRNDWAAQYALLLTFLTCGLAAPLAIYFIWKHIMSEGPMYGGKTAITTNLILRFGLVLLLCGAFYSFIIITRH